jgi:hypothetical protein
MTAYYEEAVAGLGSDSICSFFWVHRANEIY